MYYTIHMNETIKYLRESKGYTQSELAAHLGISRQMYIKYENGEVEPPVIVIIKLAKLYKVDYATIIDNKYNSSESADTSVAYNITEKKPLKFSDAGAGNLVSQNYLQAYSYACQLKYDELFKLLSGIVKLMEKQKEKPAIRKMTQEESLEVLERMSGAIKNKDYETKSYREMWYEYLDERYNKVDKKGEEKGE